MDVKVAGRQPSQILKGEKLYVEEFNELQGYTTSTKLHYPISRVNDFELKQNNYFLIINLHYI